MSDLLALADAINNLAHAIAGNGIPSTPETTDAEQAAKPRRGRPPKQAAAPAAQVAAVTPAAVAQTAPAQSSPAPAPVAATSAPTPTPPAAAAPPSTATTPSTPAPVATLPDSAPEATKDNASNALVRLIMAAKRNDVVAILGAHHAANVSALPENPKIYGDIVNKAAQVLGVTMEAAGAPIPKQA